MKNKIIPICILLLIIIILIVIGIIKKTNNNVINAIESYTMGNNILKELDDNKILVSYDEYKEYFDSELLKENDFDNNNYAIIKLSYDPCTDRNIVLSNYSINDNNIDVTFTYDRSCGVCMHENSYYLVKLDRNIVDANINIKYDVNRTEKCNQNVTYKPMIYLYPNKDMNITIKLGKPELLTTTYPKYNNGWEVYAKSNGDLIINGRLYYGLYWEGLNNINTNFEDGFIVYKYNLIPFLEEKLSILGLNEKEANEFIVYWLPILEQNEYNLIRFEDTNVIDEQMPLDINPKPNSIIRVLMEYKAIDKDYNIKEQGLNKVKRNSYTVVEWGGTEIKS